MYGLIIEKNKLKNCTTETINLFDQRETLVAVMSEDETIVWDSPRKLTEITMKGEIFRYSLGWSEKLPDAELYYISQGRGDTPPDYLIIKANERAFDNSKEYARFDAID